MTRGTEHILEEFSIAVEGEQLGLDSFSIIVESESTANCEDELTEKLHEATDADEITISTGIAAIAVVGRNISGEVSVAMKIFEALSNAHVITPLNVSACRSEFRNPIINGQSGLSTTPL